MRLFLEHNGRLYEMITGSVSAGDCDAQRNGGCSGCSECVGLHQTCKDMRDVEGIRDGFGWCLREVRNE